MALVADSYNLTPAIASYKDSSDAKSRGHAHPRAAGMQQAYPKNEAKERTKKCDEQQFSGLLGGGASETDAPGVIACSYRCLGETCFWDGYGS